MRTGCSPARRPARGGRVATQRADAFNCRGRGTCGTCAVAVEGETSDVGDRERLRLSVPPHDADADLRLACQTRVFGDVTVRKFPGFWGQHVDRDSG